MKKALSVAAILLIAVLTAGVLTACGAKPEPGNYALTEATGEGAETFKNNIDSITMEVKDDGSATIMSFGTGAVEIKFDESTGKASIEGYEIPYSVKDGVITIEDSSGKLVFQKKG